MRVQIIMALVAALVLVAVPLYLWRRPQAETISSADAAVAASARAAPVAPGASGAPALVPPGMAVAATAPRIEIAPIKTLKCQDAGPGRTPPERCDGIRAFEDALTRAIRDSQSCAPEAKSSFVMSYVLETNFSKKHQSLFLGKSTSLARSKRKDLLKCVERAMQAADWDRVPHQHQKYTINAVVTYPPSAGPAQAAPGAQLDGAPATELPGGGGPSIGSSPSRPAARPPATSKPKPHTPAKTPRSGTKKKK